MRGDRSCTRKEVDYIKLFSEKYPNLNEEFCKIQGEQHELFAKKMLSYGIENIALGTTLEDPEDKKLSLTSIWIRMQDKMNRLKNLVVKGKENPINDESVVDTWMDMCNYSVIAQIVSKDKWK